MRTFLQFIEDYKDVNPADELDKADNMNMTANLGNFSNKPILNAIRDLTRGFHLNTIVGRMFQSWTNGFNRAPVKWDLIEDSPEEAYQYRTSKSDPKANNRYKAAYSLFKQEIANAIAALPHKEGYNVKTGQVQDIMLNAKKFFQDMEASGDDLIGSLRNAFDIFWKVFGKGYSSQIRNFTNFLQIVRDEFMKIGEVLPTMGNDSLGGDEFRNNPFVRELDQEIERYEQLERQH